MSTKPKFYLPMSNQESLWVRLLSRPIIIPCTYIENDEIQPMIFSLEDGDTVIGFSSPLALAQFCGADMPYIEVDAESFLPTIMESELSFGFDFGTEDAEILTPNILEHYFKARVEDTFEPWQMSQIKSAPRDLWLEENVGVLLEGFPDHVAIYLGSIENQGYAVFVKRTDLQAQRVLMGALYELLRRHPDHDTISIIPLEDEGIEASLPLTRLWKRAPVLEVRVPYLH